MNYGLKSFSVAMGGKDPKDFADRWEQTFGKKTVLEPCFSIGGWCSLCAEKFGDLVALKAHADEKHPGQWKHPDE